MSLKGKIVRWTATDELGTFSHEGEVLGDRGSMILMMTKHGEMFLPKADGEIKVLKEAKRKAAAKAVRKTAKKAAAKRKASAPRKGSLTATAVEILSGLDRGAMTRQQMIAVLKEQMGINDHKRASGLYQSAIKKVS